MEIEHAILVLIKQKTSRKIQIFFEKRDSRGCEKCMCLFFFNLKNYYIIITT